jgi:hypothetical protein
MRRERQFGVVAVSTDPASAGAWATSEIGSGGSLNAIFCSSAPECFISDSDATVFTSTDPSGGASAWTVSPSTPPFVAGTCPTTSFCAAVDAGKKIQTTTDPGAGMWTTQAVADSLDAVACPSASLCLAVGQAGALDTSADPASGGWTHATIDDGRQLNSIACPSASLCVAADSTGHVVSSTDPTGGASAWSTALVDGDPCADTAPCYAERLQTSAGGVMKTIDSSTISGTGPFLTGLTLKGDVVSWSHDGTPRTLSLSP